MFHIYIDSDDMIFCGNLVFFFRPPHHPESEFRFESKPVPWLGVLVAYRDSVGVVEKLFPSREKRF